MEWSKNVGDFVKQGELLCVVETDKVTIEVKAQESGTIKEILAPAEMSVEKGSVLCKIQTGGAPAAGGAPASQAAAPASEPVAAAAPEAHSEPLTGLRATFARLASERLGGPAPTAAVKAPVQAPAAAKAATTASKVPIPATTVGEGRTERRVPVSFVRSRVIQRMKETQNRAALLTTFQEADLTAALAMRTKYKDLFQKTHGMPLGLLSLFAKASCCALMETPSVNALIDDGSKETVFRDYADISVPIPSPRGMISCVIRDVQSLSVRDIEHKIAGLADKARRDELAVEDLGDSTFGIVDSGVAGGMLGTAMINSPQSAVMGTNAIVKRAAVVDGKVVARPIMYLSLTYDHRLIDGREAVTFLCSVRDKMEDPTRMLLDL